MRWLALISILGLFCASCDTSSIIPHTTELPFGEFIDHVLDPLASKIADERIQQAQADLKAGQLSPALASFIGSLFAPGAGTVIGGGLAAFNKSSIEEKSAKLDARRLPLKKELLALFTKRTIEDEGMYFVCVEGAERRYGVQDGKFVRLADGLDPCETTPLKTLTKGDAN